MNLVSLVISLCLLVIGLCIECICGRAIEMRGGRLPFLSLDEVTGLMRTEPIEVEFRKKNVSDAAIQYFAETPYIVRQSIAYIRNNRVKEKIHKGDTRYVQKERLGRVALDSHVAIVSKETPVEEFSGPFELIRIKNRASILSRQGQWRWDFTYTMTVEIRDACEDLLRAERMADEFFMLDPIKDHQSIQQMASVQSELELEYIGRHELVHDWKAVQEEYMDVMHL
jgi:hypothetical protein